MPTAAQAIIQPSIAFPIYEMENKFSSPVSSASCIHVDRELAAMAERLEQPVEYDKLKTRAIGGGKQAAYIPGEAIMYVHCVSVHNMQNVCLCPDWRIGQQS